MARRDALRVGEDLGPHWKQSWLPLNADKRPTLIDCDVGVDAPVPVRSFFVEDPTAGQQGVRSMGELVKVWIHAIDCGAWQYNRREDRWEYDWRKLDPEVADLHLT